MIDEPRVKRRGRKRNSMTVMVTDRDLKALRMWAAEHDCSAGRAVTMLIRKGLLREGFLEGGAI